MKLTMQKLKEMKAKWPANRPKLKACRAEVKKKGLAGDDRWFYIQTAWTRPELGFSRKPDLQRGMTASAACPLILIETFYFYLPLAYQRLVVGMTTTARRGSQCQAWK